MFEYLYWSLMGTLLLSGLMTGVIGSIWVLLIALNELLQVMGVDRWKNYGLNALRPKKMKSGR